MYTGDQLCPNFIIFYHDEFMEIDDEKIATYRAIKINFFNALDPDFVNIMEEKKFKTRIDMYNLDQIIKNTLSQIYNKEHIKKSES